MYLWLLLPPLGVVCAYAAVWWYTRRMRSMLAGLPSYPTLPFVGNAHQILGDGRHFYKMLLAISKIMEDTDLPFIAWIGPRPAIVVKDPDDVKVVTNAFVEKPYYYSFAREYVGNGLVTAPGTIWKKTIKKLAGTFTGNIVDGFQDVFNAQGAKLVEKLKGEVGQDPFNVLQKHLAFITFETICHTALGASNVSENEGTAIYYKAFSKTMELFIDRGMNIFYHLDFLYHLSPAHKELQSWIAVLHNISMTLIRKRKNEREELHKNNIQQKESLENGRTKFKSYIDILLDMNEADPTWTEEQIRNEVDTIIVGGQETIAITMTYTLLMLGSRLEIQNKVYAELKDIFGDSKRPIQKEDLQRMNYLEAVVCETLRILPPVPFVMRDADKDLKIKSCTIPKGASCGVNIWAAGRSKKIWGPDADQYSPERWLESELTPDKSASFLAFSYGKRSCIGKRYAMPIMKTILAYVLRELEIRSDTEKLDFKVDVILKSICGNLITVKLRE